MSTKRPYRFPFAKYPAVRFALFLILGIILSTFTSLGISFWIGLFGLILFIWLTTEYQSRKNLQTYLTYTATLCYLVGIVCFGALWHSIFDQEHEPESANLLAAYTWEPIEIKGTIYNIRQTTTDKYQLDIAVDSMVLEDSLTWLEPYRLRTLYNPETQSLPEPIALGAVMHCKATVYPLKAKSNPHEFDYKQYLAIQNIYSQAGIDQILAIQPENRLLSWNTLRRGTLSLIEQNFGTKTISLAKALLIGYKNELDRNEKVAFSRVGLSHIMAVSGLHVGFIVAPFWFLIPFFWTFKHGKGLGLVLLVILLIFYAGLTGFSASVNRASITAGLITYGRLFYKSRDPRNLTAVAAIIILLYDPNDLFDIGFQLSFGAVYIILLVLPVLQQIIPRRIQFRWYGTPVMIVVVSLVVQAGLYPLLSYYFGEFSLVGPITNALIVPWLSFIVPYALIMLPVSALFPELGAALNLPCRWFLDTLHWFVSTAASWQWSWIQTPSTGVFIFMIWIATVFLIAASPLPKIRWKMLILLLVILCMQQLQKGYHLLQSPELRITLWDVGQGDAALVQTPSGRNFLIDTGRWTPTYNSARYVIIPHLKAEGIEKLDAVFLSHPHADHIGGIIELINEIEIDAIYNSGFIYDSQLYKKYITLAEKSGIAVQSLAAGENVPIDSAVRLYIYGPGKNNYHADPNEYSLIMELIYGETEFLFTGDAGETQEQRVLRNFGSLIDTDFLKVGHHGSRTSSSESFLDFTTPTYAAVSLGENNKFNHPHPKATRRLSSSGAKTYFTSLEGALVFTSDGRVIHREKW